MSKRKRQFVIQKHDASQLHYDLRLEVDGVLKSWAIPKGPSTDPSEKRLAIEVDDHDMEAKDFEGRIHEDEYGGGTMLIWDRGDYDNLMADKKDGMGMKKAHKEGHIEVYLHGEKLMGGYVLTRFREDEDKPQWLFIKMDDDEADARRNPVSTEPDSVESGRSLKEIHDEEEPVSAEDD
ncbi:MAG: DNA polymerase ligase N-terminal domain-containing protein [Akkermansiaceae bacterium]|nr:DNA polymerase ligase N-terminal domain-containing protein [Akkermansiaceae bacterium]